MHVLNLVEKHYDYVTVYVQYIVNKFIQSGDTHVENNTLVVNSLHS